MALNKIEIVVVDGGKSAVGNQTGSGNTPAIKQAKKSEKLKNKNLSAKFKALQDPLQAAQNKITGKMSASGAFVTNMAISLGKQFISQSLDYYVSNIGRQNGDSNYQNIVNHNISSINDITNTLGSVLGSAAAGAAVGGVAGAVVGAAVGAVSSAMSIGFRQAERERTYQHQLFQDRNNQANTMARANYSVWTGRSK